MKCIFVCFILLFNHFTGISSGDELTASSADFDGDKEVTVLDFLLFQDAFGTQAGNSEIASIYFCKIEKVTVAPRKILK